MPAKCRGLHFVLVRQHQEAGHDREAENYRQNLTARQKRHGIRDEADQRKSAHAAERVLLIPGLVLFSFQTGQEREEEHQQDLGAFRRQQAIEVE